MGSWRNESGLPLSASDWLQNHHQAKLAERGAFAERVAALQPSRIVDIGCATGLWLELLHRVLPAGCEVIGIEADASAIQAAMERSRSWNRPITFLHADAELAHLPPADLFLCFNMFGYFTQHELFLKRLKESLSPGGSVILRQYDAATMRLGRMEQRKRLRLDTSLFASVGDSQQFNHYPMDATLAAVSCAGFERVTIEFETFCRVSPFPERFHPYLQGSIDWLVQHLAEESRSDLSAWMERATREPLHYFSETDLICWLS